MRGRPAGRGRGRGVLAAGWLAAAVAGCARGESARLAVTALPTETVAGAVRAAFELRNGGGRPLFFDRVLPACGCDAWSRLPAELVPGGATRLDVECRPARVAGDDVREIRLRTSDPRSPETLLRVVLGRVPASLAPVYLGYVAVGTTFVRDVALPSTVGEIAPGRGGELAVEAQPPAADGTPVVRVRFTPRAPGVVRTAVDLGPAGRLPLTAVAYEGVMAFPPEVRVPRPTGSIGLPTITLVAAGARPLAIARVEYPPGMTGELRALVPGRQYRLVLRARGPMATTDAVIRVVAEGAADPVLVIPLVDAIADGARPSA